LIKQEINKDPKSPNFVDNLAALCNLEGRYEEAERYYRRVLDLSPEHAYAMNNLAWLLALKGGENRKEALMRINKAIEISGPEPSLLDTRGVIYLSLGDRKALDDLQQATDDGPSASKYFHLARAQLELGDPIAAQDALNKAMVAGLKPESLHPLEQPMYDNVVSRITRKDQTTLRSSGSQRTP
jgi:tetratricopeptide (TPR) repeat protein